VLSVLEAVVVVGRVVLRLHCVREALAVVVGLKLTALLLVSPLAQV